MKTLKEMSLVEVAAFVADHLRRNRIDVALTGGACVSVYSGNRYVSNDLDFIENFRTDRKKLARILAQIGLSPGTGTSCTPTRRTSWSFRRDRWRSGTNRCGKLRS